MKADLQMTLYLTYLTTCIRPIKITSNREKDHQLMWEFKVRLGAINTYVLFNIFLNTATRYHEILQEYANQTLLNLPLQNVANILQVIMQEEL